MLSAKQLFDRRKQRTRFALKQKAKIGALRLSVHRSGKNISAQIIDDKAGKTLVAASSLAPELRGKKVKGGNIDGAKAVGALLAEKAKAAKIDTVVFDRGGYLFHGRVKALADAARDAGLKF